jgi:hypothetical protein
MQMFGPTYHQIEADRRASQLGDDSALADAMAAVALANSEDGTHVDIEDSKF